MSFIMEKGFLGESAACGVNFWGSRSALRMWSDWDEGSIEADLKALKDAGLSVLRVFPLWSDFQPLKALLGWGGVFKEASSGIDTSEELTPEGISAKCIGEFDTFCDLSEKYGFRLIVPLITGYMSGRSFFPELIAGKNAVTDPFCIKLEVQFIEYFVKRFMDRKCIAAWELGNECNCLGATSSDEQAWLWTYALTSAVKRNDTTRPVISGMHGLCSPDSPKNGWSVKNQGELCDIFTVHPYFLFTSNCARDGVLSPRGIFHAVAEQTMYSDLGHKPCFIEEIGTLGNIYGNEETVKRFAMANLLSALAYNSAGMLWWTAFDQTEQAYSPYEWVDCERELGMLHFDRSEKPIVSAFKQFAQVKSLLNGRISERIKNAVFIGAPNDWDGMFGGYLLAKRAGLELSFADIDKPLPEAGLYIISGNGSVKFLRRSVELDLIERVKNGATLLATYGGGSISLFEQLFGISSLGRVAAKTAMTSVNGKTVVIGRSIMLKLEAVTAETLALDGDGNPLLTRNRLGKGNALFLNAPLERSFLNEASDTLTNSPEEIYRIAAAVAGVTFPVEKSSVNTYFTLHRLENGNIAAICINGTDKAIDEKFTLNGYRIIRTLYGNADISASSTTIASGDGVIFELEEL